MFGRLLAVVLLTGGALFAPCFDRCAEGRGLLIPVEKDLPPLAMLNHHVDVSIEDQVATSTVKQTFRNHTSRALEATYVFPVPAGASVRKFAMWVDGRRIQGELLPAKEAAAIYTDIVRQTKEPGLLEHIGANLLRMKVYPVPPQDDQQVEVQFTAVAEKQHDVVQYTYPLKSDRVAATPLEEFRFSLSLKTSRPLGAVYSPTHDVVVDRLGERQAEIQFEREEAPLDQDFQIFYTHSGDEVGLTALKHRPISDEDGYAMLLLSPSAQLDPDQKPPRDIVFVLDTSGSMIHDKKMDQAKQAVRHCLGQLSEQDRFGLVTFSTSAYPYREELTAATEQQIKKAKGWVAGQYATGGTAMHAALMAALQMRTGDSDRMFTIVLFTDGEPTIGETNVETILQQVAAKNSSNTRIFCFGVGDDLNAVLLDQLAEQTRALTQYVRSGESLQAKAANFFAKINFPVLTNLKLESTGGVRLLEVYPPNLPDLFYGDQLAVMARYANSGASSIRLTGRSGGETKRFVYETTFPAFTDEKPFVEELWARRKVGYLLDQIRINGENKELVDEVTRLAKSYGVTTPYTSFLIMPDTSLNLARAGSDGASSRMARRGEGESRFRGLGGGFGPGRFGERPSSVEEYAKDLYGASGDFGSSRQKLQERALQKFAAEGSDGASEADEARPANSAATAPAAEPARENRRLAEAKRLKSTLDKAKANFQHGHLRQNQTSALGVELAEQTNELKRGRRIRPTAIRHVAGRRLIELGGVWIDQHYTPAARTLTVKAQSDAYFQLLRRRPELKDVFQLGNHLVWMTPSGVALVVDTAAGKTRLSSKEMKELFP